MSCILGSPNGLYHREEDQEDFLVLAGECIAIVEGQERRLRALGLHALPGRDRAHLAWAPARDRA